jgi:hypothetical protein
MYGILGHIYVLILVVAFVVCYSSRYCLLKVAFRYVYTYIYPDTLVYTTEYLVRPSNLNFFEQFFHGSGTVQPVEGSLLGFRNISSAKWLPYELGRRLNKEATVVLLRFCRHPKVLVSKQKHRVRVGG